MMTCLEDGDDDDDDHAGSECADDPGDQKDADHQKGYQFSDSDNGEADSDWRCFRGCAISSSSGAPF